MGLGLEIILVGWPLLSHAFLLIGALSKGRESKFTGIRKDGIEGKVKLDYFPCAF